MPHVWDKAPQWARAEATAHYLTMQIIEQWGGLSNEERKRMLSKVPKVENG